MVRVEGPASNRLLPPPLRSGAPPPQAGEENQHALLQELSDGLERLMKAEGAVIAPDRTDVREDMEKVVPAAGLEPARALPPNGF